MPLHNCSLSFNQRYLLMSFSLWSHFLYKCVHFTLIETSHVSISFNDAIRKHQKAAIFLMTLNYGCLLKIMIVPCQICTTWEAYSTPGFLC